MAVPHIFRMTAFHVSHDAQQRSMLLWHKWAPKWRKKILRWPVDHDSHTSICQTHLGEMIIVIPIIVVDTVRVSVIGLVFIATVPRWSVYSQWWYTWSCLIVIYLI